MRPHEIPKISLRELNCGHIRSLWVNRTRHLAGRLFEVLERGHVDDIPARTVRVLRQAVAVLLDNMVGASQQMFPGVANAFLFIL